MFFYAELRLYRNRLASYFESDNTINNFIVPNTLSVAMWLIIQDTMVTRKIITTIQYFITKNELIEDIQLEYNWM